jgi:hypothetical protein
MLLKLLRGTGPGVLSLLILTTCIFWAGSFLHPQLPGIFIYETRPMPLYGLLKMAIGTNPLVGEIFTFVLFCFMLFFLVSFNTSIFFINERTFLPACFYTLFIAIFPQYQVMNPVLPASIFLMMAMRRIMDSYRKPGTAYNFFDAGIYISIGTLFYADLAWFGALLIVGIIILRSGNLIEIIISLLGLAAPFVITAGLYYVLGKDIGILLTDIRDNLIVKAAGYQFTRLSVILLIYTGLIVIVSTGFLVMRMNSKKIKSRKTFSLLLWSLIISFALFIFVPSVSVEIIWITGIPACYLLAHYFIFERKKIFAEIVFTLFFLLVLLIQALNIF